MGKLDGRVALVTGAGSGIGRAIATLFAEEGARVVVNDIRRDAAEATAKLVDSRGRAIVADVADSAQVRAMFESVDREFGRLDVLVNNAGIAATTTVTDESRQGLLDTVQARLAAVMSGQPVEAHFDITRELTDEAWHRMIAVHLDGTFFCTRQALALMSRANRGSIVNMSSVAGLMGLETVPHYSAAKAGILGFTRAVAREVGSRGIRVNAICPGYVDTPMTEPIPPFLRAMTLARTPLGRTGDPREIATTALFLASDDSSFFTGQWLSPNGGLFIG